VNLEHLVVRGYVPGGGLISPMGIFYLNIPKNASTYLTNLLSISGWQHTNISNPNITECIAVLRDPIDRWVSGFATYTASWLLGPNYGSTHFVEDYNELTERIIFDQIVFDDHTTEQVQYVKQLGNTKTTFFKLGYNIGGDLESFLGHRLGLNNLVPANISEDNYDTNIIAKTMRYKIDQDPVLKAKIIDRYSEDYTLIKSATFHYEPR